MYKVAVFWLCKKTYLCIGYWWGHQNSTELKLAESIWHPAASLVAQRLKRLPPMWETRVRPVGWEDPPEEGLATHSSVLAWETPWTGEPGGLQSTGSQSWTWLSDLAHTHASSTICASTEYQTELLYLLPAPKHGLDLPALYLIFFCPSCQKEEGNNRLGPLPGIAPTPLPSEVPRRAEVRSSSPEGGKVRGWIRWPQTLPESQQSSGFTSPYE